MYYEWFQLRTAQKLPASYRSGFWDTLVFQTSMSEPAVWHAALALASFHRNAILQSEGDEGTSSTQPRLMLHHFLKAVEHLQKHFQAKDQSSYRVALVVCILFASLDLLRGHIQQAQVHLKNGSKILGEMRLLCLGDYGPHYMRKNEAESDRLLSEAHARLRFQFQLIQPLQPTLPLPEAPVGIVSVYPSGLSFLSLREAWGVLEKYMKQTSYLGEIAARPKSKREDSSVELTSRLQRDQQKLRDGLAVWLEQWESFSAKYLQSPGEEQKANWLLRCFHIVATIMTETCLSPEDESAYDLHTDKFISLAIHMIKLRSISLTDAPIQSPTPDQDVEIAKSVIDVGINQPLYYLATRCRVHRLRLQAIRMLESSAHREGVWESRTAGVVARKVMELEEKDLDLGENGSDNFPILEYPVNPADLSRPMPPAEHRLQQVQVDLLGEPTDTIVLRYQRETAGGVVKPCTSTYDARERHWQDMTPAGGVKSAVQHLYH